MPDTYLTQKARAARTANPQETAFYTFDMLMSLKRLAEKNKQEKLAALIGQAADEAQIIARTPKAEEK